MSDLNLDYNNKRSDNAKMNIKHNQNNNRKLCFMQKIKELWSYKILNDTKDKLFDIKKYLTKKELVNIKIGYNRKLLGLSRKEISNMLNISTEEIRNYESNSELKFVRKLRVIFKPTFNKSFTSDNEDIVPKIDRLYFKLVKLISSLDKDSQIRIILILINDLLERKN